MKKYIILVLTIFLSGCFMSKPMFKPTGERYKISLQSNPTMSCSLLMLNNSWTAINGLFYKKIARRKMFEAAITKVSKYTKTSIVIPQFENDIKYNTNILWPLINDAARKSETSLSTACYKAMDGLFKSTDDPYTRYVPPSKAANTIGSVFGNRYFGSGFWYVTFLEKKAPPIVKSVFLERVYANSPAKKAGLKKYDEVLKIDGTPIKGISGYNLLGMFRGPKDSKIKLLIMRKGWKAPREFIIGRGLVGQASARCKLINKVPYCKVDNFSANVFDELKASFESLSDHKKQVIIDLRNNGGGLLNSAHWMLVRGWWDRRMSTMTFLKKGKYSPIYLNPADKTFVGHTTVLLVNRNTASASEAVTAALQDYNLAYIIGENTYGKGLVQGMMFSLGAILFVTHAEFLSPLGKIINKQGIKPDLEVKMGPEHFRQNIDPVLKAGIEYLKKVEKYRKQD